MTSDQKILLQRCGLSALMGGVVGFFAIFIGFFISTLFSMAFSSVGVVPLEVLGRTFVGNMLLSITFALIAIPFGAVLGAVFYASIAKKTLHIPYSKILNYAGTYTFWACALALMVPIINYVLLGTFAIVVIAYIGFQAGVRKLEHAHEPG